MARPDDALRAHLEALLREFQERSVALLRKHLAASAPTRRAAPPVEAELPTDTDRALAGRIRRRAGLAPRRAKR